ncbi:MAG: beta-lactamase family protein [Oceanicaulis sp.]|nr:beta-lactamase family protein [Oceanicaulis sp.]
MGRRPFAPIRRSGLIAAAASVLLLASCAIEAEPMGDVWQERLESLLETEGARAPGAAVAVVRDGRVLWASAAGAAAFDSAGQTPERALEASTPVRAASISKLAVALTAGALAGADELDLDAPIRMVLPRAPRHPLDPDAPITLRQLLSHTSGVCDPARYWAELGEDFFALFNDEAAWCDHAPGAGFTYSNLGYALAASVLEAAGGERFDRLARRHALIPAGLPGAGFNWSGVERSVRDGGGALHRWTDGAWRVQIDSVSMLAGEGPVVLVQPGHVLEDYQPGANGSLMSPQGGLRANVIELARLAEAFAPGGPGEALTGPVWRGDAGPGLRAWATGPQVMEPGQIPGRPDLTAIGHPGQAWGLYGGAWFVPGLNASIAYFVTGEDPDEPKPYDPVSGLTAGETALFALALDWLDVHDGAGL